MAYYHCPSGALNPLGGPTGALNPLARDLVLKEMYGAADSGRVSEPPGAGSKGR
jgi:hypothetical protein